ncbi:MAG: uracil-DNA glycosylase [Burkholderiales bacterium]|nr:uracil-DNA glycosylase [Burkholderiales bacterium]
MDAQKYLQAMGLGPVWHLRNPETLAATPEVAPEMPSPLVDVAEEKNPPAVDIAQQEPVRDVTPVQVKQLLTEDMSWEVLQETVAACQACRLCQGRQKTVFGVGDQKARWLFVGEGPGYNENIQGQPFVGTAGQLLDNMLNALGLKRGEATYIANVVKCRPTDDLGKDRPPSADEIAACLPYLQRQIALIQPEVIVALGKTAAIALLGLSPETPVGQLREKVHHYQSLPLIVTYHPAYLLRKPADKAKAWADLCLARSSLGDSAA